MAAVAAAGLKQPLLLPPTTKASSSSVFSLEKLLFNFVAPSVHGSSGIALDPEPSGLADATARLRHRLDGKNESLLRSLVAVFWLPMANAAACKLASDLLRYVPPLLLSRLLLCLSGGGGSDCSAFEDYSLALLLPLTMLALMQNEEIVTPPKVESLRKTRKSLIPRMITSVSLGNEEPHTKPDAN